VVLAKVKDKGHRVEMLLADRVGEVLKVELVVVVNLTLVVENDTLEVIAERAAAVDVDFGVRENLVAER
jgi:hypothetical protein